MGASVIGQSNIDCLLTYLDPHIYLLDVRLAILAYCLSVPLFELYTWPNADHITLLQWYYVSTFIHWEV